MTSEIESAYGRNSARIQLLGEFLLRYGLVLVLGWIGAMKFTAYEADGIKPLIENRSLRRKLLRERFVLGPQESTRGVTRAASLLRRVVFQWSTR